MTPKIKIWKKCKKHLETLSCTINQDHDVWFLRYKAKFFVILPFLPFDPPNNPKNQNFEKMKKNPLEIIITLHKYTINDNHMIYGSRDINCKRQIFFLSSSTIFSPFYSPNSPKTEKFKKWKKYQEISSFSTSVPKIMIMLYCSWGMARDRCNCCFSSWANFCPFTPLTARKMKRSRKWKKLQEISSFYISAPTLMIICHTGPEICCVTDVIVIFHFGLFFPLLSP